MNPQIDFSKLNGLIPVVIQEYQTKDILMLAFMNEESLKKTIETGETWFWSRSKQTLWHKGETSGNIQKVKEIFLDCDNDTLLITVEQVGGVACHTGKKSCFFTTVSINS
ncbi:MAG: phosphoribosyl-AMP cyclohydrolase [bacterium]